jgi:hypothetical protein
LSHDGPIKLGEAPARFFADDWERLALLKGGEAKALEVLDNPDPGILVFYRRQSLENGRGTPADRAAAMAEEEADVLVHRLHDGLRALGSEGRVIASGLFAGTGLRQAIPAELWALAKVGFGAGAVASNGFVYHNVTVEPAATPVDVENVVAAMSAWLGRRRAGRGNELKQILQHAARKEFGDAFTVRAFNIAYTACYKRTRGRPQKIK